MYRCKFCTHLKQLNKELYCNILPADINAPKCKFYSMRSTTKSDFVDAAEFEARVAKKLVDIAFDLYGEGFSDGHDGCYTYEDYEPDKFEILKEARLAVEQEMDG